jgi:hypothetical protein
MKRKIKLFLIPFMLLATLFLVTACGNKTNAYDDNDAKGHTVSVKYDANGGVFTGTSTVMVDSFNIADMKTDSDGMVNLKLIKPTDEARGDWTPANGNKVLAGWYKTRIETTDDKGNKIYTYADEFDFDTHYVTVDPNKTYTSSEPVLTLYAVWVEKFVVNFINIEDGTHLGSYEYNPDPDSEAKPVLNTPVWNTDTGRLDMFKFPEIKGKTFEAAYEDAEGTKPLGDVIVHNGYIDKYGVAQDTVKNVYVKYMEGNWYHVYTAKQMSGINDVTGNIVLHADLDFSEKGAFWPSTFIHGTFTGSIEGNGHTIKNVTIEQSSNTVTQTGLFGKLAAGAKISNVTFENVTLKITKGARTPGAVFGLLAGRVEAGAELKNVAVTSGVIEINADTCYWPTADFDIGLLCGTGSFEEGSDLAAIDISGITCVKAGEKALTITIDGNSVTIVSG